MGVVQRAAEMVVEGEGRKGGKAGEREGGRERGWHMNLGAQLVRQVANKTNDVSFFPVFRFLVNWPGAAGTVVERWGRL
jgi:hypothetical protein